MRHSQHKIKLQIIGIVIKSPMNTFYGIGHLIFHVELPTTIHNGTKIAIFDRFVACMCRHAGSAINGSRYFLCLRDLS